MFDKKAYSKEYYERHKKLKGRNKRASVSAQMPLSKLKNNNSIKNKPKTTKSNTKARKAIVSHACNKVVSSVKSQVEAMTKDRDNDIAKLKADHSKVMDSLRNGRAEALKTQKRKNDALKKSIRARLQAMSPEERAVERGSANKTMEQMDDRYNKATSSIRHEYKQKIEKEMNSFSADKKARQNKFESDKQNVKNKAKEQIAGIRSKYSKKEKH